MFVFSSYRFFSSIYYYFFLLFVVGLLTKVRHKLSLSGTQNGQSGGNRNSNGTPSTGTAADRHFFRCCVASVWRKTSNAKKNYWNDLELDICSDRTGRLRAIKCLGELSVSLKIHHDVFLRLSVRPSPWRKWTLFLSIVALASLFTSSRSSSLFRVVFRFNLEMEIIRFYVRTHLASIFTPRNRMELPYQLIKAFSSLALALPFTDSSQRCESRALRGRTFQQPATASIYINFAFMHVVDNKSLYLYESSDTFLLFFIRLS